MLIEIWQVSDNKTWQHPAARGPSGEVGYPLYRLRGASRPAEIQWQSSIKISERPIRQSGVRGAPGGVFTRPQAGAYEANRRIAAALRPSGVLFRRGQSNPCRSTEYPKQPEGLIKKHSEEPSSENHPRRRREPAKKKGAGGQTVSSLRTSLLTSLLAHTAQRSVMGRGPPVRVDIWPPASVMMRLPAA